MSSKVFAIIGLTIVSLFELSNANTYYVSKTGNDNNSGTINSPWLTTSKVQSTMVGGDTVFFCTGIWRDVALNSPSGGTFSDRTVYACSSFVRGIAKLYGGDSLGGWIQHSGSVYKIPYNIYDDLYTLAQDDSLLFKQPNLSSVNGPGKFYPDPVRDTIYVWAYGGDDPDNYDMETGNNRIIAIDASYVTVRDLTLKYARGRGIVIIASAIPHPEAPNILYCNISHVSDINANNASCINLSWSEVPGDSSANIHDFVVRSCSLSYCHDEIGWAQNHGNGINTYSVSYAVIESCAIGPHLYTGIHRKNRLTDGSLALYNTIRDNKIYNTYGDGIWVDIHPYNDSLYGNVINNCGGGITLSCYDYNPPLGYGVHMLNNTIVDCGSGISGNSEYSSYELYDGKEAKYNIIYGTTRHDYNLTAAQDIPNWSVDSNLVYGGSYNFNISGVSSDSDSWQSHGFDTHSKIGINPQFANYANEDFSRPDAPQEMNLTYGGRTWTKFGAIQGITPPDTTEPSFSNIRSTDTTSNSVNIRWNTNEASNSRVEYGTTTGYGSWTQLDPSMVISHTQTITGLSPLTSYHYRVHSSDGAGNEAVSGDYTFSTLAPDTTPPIISGVGTGNIGSSTAIISWSTNEVATSQVDYGLTTAYGLSTSVDSSLVQNHSLSLSGLMPDTLYHFRVRSADAAGNESVSGDYSFNTDTLATYQEMQIDSIMVCGTYPGYSSIHIADGIIAPRGGTSSTWASDQDATSPHWVVLNFPSVASVGSVRISWAWNGYNSSWMTSQQYNIEYWDDENSGYTNAVVVNNSTADSVTITDFAPVSTRAIRIYQPANMGPSNYPSILWVTEIEIFGVLGIDTPVNRGTDIYPQDSTAIVSVYPIDAQMPIFYEFALDESELFPAPRIEPPLVADTVVATAYTGLDQARTYYWHCRAIASDLSDTSLWSPTVTFNLESSAIGDNFIVSPSNGSVVLSRYFDFEVNFGIPQSGFAVELSGPIPQKLFKTGINPENLIYSPMPAFPNPDFTSISCTADSSTREQLLSQNDSYYFWRVSTDQSAWKYYSFKLALDVHAYPVPFRAGAAGGNNSITFTNLPESSKLTITSVSGELVLEKSELGPSNWVWDTKNNSGKLLASGVYLFAVESNSGTYTGKIMIIR